MRILVGITGGIAAYKSASLVRELVEAGHDVQVLPTENALRFIGSATLEALSHNPIDPGLYTQVADVKHIKLAQSADLVIVAPATASFLARYAAGLADDLLLNVLLATKADVVLAPAMHTEMWMHESTQTNIKTLTSRGVHIIEPTSGRLTGSDTGIGRMAEPQDIVSAALHLAEFEQDYLGTHVVVVAGGTHEAIDSVRFIGNSSSGKQGLALAASARDRGAKVTLIAANISLPLPAGVQVMPVVNHAQLEEAVNNAYETADIILMPAAVSDFRVSEITDGKLSRSTTEELILTLVPNSDVLAGLGQRRGGETSPILVGFAAEVTGTESELIGKAQSKLHSKQIDMVVANDVSANRIFGADETAVVLVSKDQQLPLQGPKTLVADAILSKTLEFIQN